MEKRIAFISENACPVEASVGIYMGSTEVYVAELASQLVSNGYCVDIFTRSAGNEETAVTEWVSGVRVIHIKAGNYSPKEELMKQVEEFTANTLSFIRDTDVSYHLIHAHFWTSALVASK